MPGKDNCCFIVDMRERPAAVTWETAGRELVFHLATGGEHYTFIVGPEAIRQLRQMLSWAAGPMN